MSKLLPINTDPTVRIYTYHLFLNSIMSANYGDGGILADITMNNKELNNFDYGKYCNIIRNENSLMIHANQNGSDTHIILQRVMESNDQCTLKVNTHKLNCSWSIINLFAGSKDRIEADNSAECRIGMFSNTTLCSEGDICNSIDNDGKYNIIDPYYLRITRKGTLLKGEMSSNGKVWHTANESILEDTANKVVGIEVNFGKNEYLSWLYNNYIHVYFNKNAPTHIDYLYSPQKNYHFCTYNPLVNFSRETQKFILLKYNSIIEYIIHNIDNNRYVELQFDEYFIPNRDTYLSHHMIHGNLAYGYDDEHIYFLSMYHGRPDTFSLSYSDVIKGCEAAREEYTNNAVIIYEISSENYEFNVTLLYKSLRDYLLGIVDNIEYYNVDNKDNIYGIKILDELLDESGFYVFLSDIRIAYLLKEHACLMRDRVYYLINIKLISEPECSLILKLLDDICQETSIMIGLVIKYSMTQKVDVFNNIYSKLKKMRDIQIECYTALLNLLKPLVDKDRIAFY